MFSWEKPIEEETLKFCNTMASQFRRAEAHQHDDGLFGTGFLADNSYSRHCGDVAMVYETVAKHIKREIKIRKRVKEQVKKG